MNQIIRRQSSQLNTRIYQLRKKVNKLLTTELIN